MSRPAKLGDCVQVAIPQHFQLNTTDALYFDKHGRPCDEHGHVLGMTQYRTIVLDTIEAVEYFNRTGKVLPNA